MLKRVRGFSTTYLEEDLGNLRVAFLHRLHGVGDVHPVGLRLLSEREPEVPIGSADANCGGRRWNEGLGLGGICHSSTTSVQHSTPEDDGASRFPRTLT